MCAVAATVVSVETALWLCGVASALEVDRNFDVPCEYRFAPGEKRNEWNVSFTANSHGLREREIAAHKEKNEMRILCMGDSCTFGAGENIPEKDLYVRQLESQLQVAFPKREVVCINAGMPGYSAWQGNRLLPELLDAYHPDIVTIYYGWNDHWRDCFSEKNKYLLRRVDRLINASRLVSVLNRRVMGKPHTFRIERAWVWMKYKQQVFRTTPDEYRAELERMIFLCRRHGAQPVLLTAPCDTARAVPGKAFFSVQPYDAFLQHKKYNNVTRACAHTARVPLVDLDSQLTDKPGCHELFDDFVHPGSRGHRIIASAIGQRISQLFR